MKRFVNHRLIRIFCLSLLLAVGVAVLSDGVALAQQSGAVPGKSLGSINDSEFWRSIRQGKQGLVSIPDRQAGIMIQSEGEEWRSIRNGPISTYGGYLLALSLGAIVAFFLVRGRVAVESGDSGRTIMRFSISERVIHWYVAILFVLLALTGLNLLFGKYVLIPVIGQGAFAAMASGSILIHNYMGPLFILGLVAMFITYVKHNLPKAEDMTWLMRGGIMFKSHIPSWKYNFGEKIWFWLAMITGVALSVTGIYMDFPYIAESLGQLQLFSIIHSIAALACMAAAIGHIYLGTIGVKGAFDGMIDGQVDENWAKEHHSLWAEEEIAAQGQASSSAASDRAPAE